MRFLPLLALAAALAACARPAGPPPLPVTPTLGELTAELILDKVP